MQKMFEQKQIISNRLEFLDQEKNVVLSDVKKSSAKEEIVERKKDKVKKQAQDAYFKKQDENRSLFKRGQ